VVFVDAVHPAHQVRVVGCWAPEGKTIAISPTSGRDRLNIHGAIDLGAIDLATGQTQMIEVLTVDALSKIQFIEAILLAYLAMFLIYIYLDNARYHHAKLVKQWLACNGARIKLYFIPAYSPHLNPIERLWGAMHKNLTHNKSYGTLIEFQEKVMNFLKYDVPRQWEKLRDSVTDNFRVINPADFRVVR
jgi:transposase